MKDKIIVALDVNNASDAVNLISSLPQVSCFKIGPHFFIDEMFAGLFQWDWQCKSLGSRSNPSFFLDFKHFDINETVRKTITHSTVHHIRFLTVHAHTSLMRTAVAAARYGTKVLAVPLLTSFGPEDLKEFYNYNGLVVDFVLERTRRAIDCGCHGIICSPQEVAAVRAIIPDNFLIVVPGIRPTWWVQDDHKRSGTPKQAIDDGADFIVIGRPIIHAPKPTIAYQKILEEIY